MIKKIDSGNSIVISDFDNGVCITYFPKLASKKLGMIKLNKAVLKFKIGAVANQNHNVFFENKKTGIDEIIDVFNTSDNEVCIDITDELQACLSNSEQEIVFHITNLKSTNISDGQVHFEYYFKKQVLKDQATYPIDAGRAGSGEINLATGVLKLSYEDVKTNSKVLPISVRHTFNSLDAGSENAQIPFFDDFVTLPNFNCGKGWKTNFHQFIVKEANKEGTFSDEETSARYTYINADGDHIIFEDKYYYENNNGKKCYIPSNVVHVNQDNELSYLDAMGFTREVIKETKSDSGLTLVTKFENMKGVSLLLQDNEDVISLKEDIKSIQKSKKEMQEQIDLNIKTKNLIELSKEISEINYEIQESNLDNEQNDITLQELLKSKNDEYKALYKEFSTLVDERTYKYADLPDENHVTYPTTNEKNKKMEYEAKSDEIEKSRDDATYGDGGTLSLRKTNLPKQISLLNKNKQYSSEQYDLEIQKIDEQNKSYQTSIEEYDRILTQKSHQLDTLLSETPEVLITDDNGNILGFIPTDNKNIYKLFVIMDNYENQIQIVYEDGNIEKIIDSDNNSILFSYQNGLLDTIEDSRQRKLSFKYDSKNNLTEVKYPSGIICEYGYDESGNLVSLKNDNGSSYRLQYSNGQVTKVEQVTYSSKITKDTIDYLENKNSETKDSVEIDYYDYESTQVTNTMSNKSTTYVFDTIGRIITKYDNVFENGSIVGNVNAISFERSNDQSSFAIKDLAYSENFLSTIKSKNSKVSSVSENYMGTDAFCGEDVSTLNIKENKVENELFDCDSSDPIVLKVLTPELISKIKNKNISDLVLSGWAKADSAWVKRRNTDYCGSCEESEAENSLEQLLITCMDKCKEVRRFELRAKLTYINNSQEKIVEQYCSFDWMNTQWQYCAFPVTLSEDPNDELVGLEVCFDYSNNTGKAQFYGMSLKCGEWEYTEFKEGMKSYSESSNSDYITRYEYDTKKNLIKSISQSKLNGKEFITTYDYNQNCQLVRTVDYRNIVTENVYNDKGSKIKSMTYNLAEPANKFYTEEEIDDKGQETTEINEFGEKVFENIFIDKTGIIESTIDKDGNKISYGYDVYDDTLLHMTTTINNEINSNVMQYNGDLLTSLTHNNVEINFEYNGFGQQTKSIIAGNLYSSTEYSDIYEMQVQENGTEEKKILVGQKSITTYAKNDEDPFAEQFITYTNIDGNLIKVEFRDKKGSISTLIENRFDSYGNLIYTKDNELCSETGLYYDEFGRVVEKSSEQDGVFVSIKNDYDKYGNVKVSTIDIGGVKSTTTNNYDYSMPEPKLESISFNGITESYAYDKLERVNETKLGNLYSKQFNYLQKGDHTSNLIASEWFGVNGIVKDSLKYNYDQNGNITKVFENGVEIARYTYDAISRLIREDNKKLEKTTTFEYDGGGNIVNKTLYAYTTKDTELLVDGKVIPYLYPITGWRDQVIAYGDEKIEYDVLGNPTTYRNNDLKWSHARQLDKFNEIQFTYNADGIRTGKVVNNVPTTFYLDGTKILAQDNGNFLMFHYGCEGVIGFTYQGVGEYYYKKNILGDIIAIIDKNGIEIAKYVYDAWGNHKTFVLNDGQYVDISTYLSYTQDGLNNKLIAEINPFRYRGYYFDTETNLYYLNSRYYDPETGRFINADDLSILNEGKDVFNGLNLYNYCGNNPIMNTDHSGYAWWDWLISIVIAVVVIVAVVAVSVLTAGLGTAIGTALGGGAAAMIFGSAAGGAITGAITGAIVGAGISIISQGMSNGYNNIDWGKVGMNTLLGAASGAISGALFGAISGTVKVFNAAKAWAPTGGKSGFKQMTEHYAKHVIKEGQQAVAKNILNYTKQATQFFAQNNASGVLLREGVIKIAGAPGGIFNTNGLIRSFWYILKP